MPDLFSTIDPTPTLGDILARRPPFDGATYVPELDDARLTGQIRRVYDLMRDGRWRTLQEIADATGDPAASISSQLRHLRKERFGSHLVDKRPRGERSHGLWEYCLIVNTGDSE